MAANEVGDVTWTLPTNTALRRVGQQIARLDLRERQREKRDPWVRELAR